MSSRFADPTAMRTRSPIYHDDNPKRPPPSPSNKAPPPKKFDAKSRAVSEELCLPSKAQPLATPSSESFAESCPDKLSANRDVVDMEVFDQILEIDEGDDTREFSRGLVKDYLDQAQATIKQLDESFAKHDLTQLGKLGHYLKGSSASLGVVRVQEICENMQHFGNRIDPKEPDVNISTEDAFARIKPLLARLKDEHAAADKVLKKFLEGCSKP
ncbi:Signal transduction histidine kinase, phosphotransfer (Hpt) domain containing protein [Tylopilus felleus]